jgi:hypothetical protein
MGIRSCQFLNPESLPVTICRVITTYAVTPPPAYQIERSISAINEVVLTCLLCHAQASIKHDH